METAHSIPPDTRIIKLYATYHLGRLHKLGAAITEGVGVFRCGINLRLAEISQTHVQAGGAHWPQEVLIAQ